MACGVCCEEPLIYNTLSKMRTPPGSRKGYFLCWKRARWNCGSFGDPCGTKEIMQTLHDLPAISSLWLRRTCGSLGEVLSQQVLCAGELDAFPTPKTSGKSRRREFCHSADVPLSLSQVFQCG